MRRWSKRRRGNWQIEVFVPAGSQYGKWHIESDLDKGISLDFAIKQAHMMRHIRPHLIFRLRQPKSGNVILAAIL